jgi:hypothetical protein
VIAETSSASTVRTNRAFTYLHVDGWKYWSLPGQDGVTIINRARLPDQAS